jgi:hypothetical protein
MAEELMSIPKSGGALGLKMSSAKREFPLPEEKFPLRFRLFRSGFETLV